MMLFVDELGQEHSTIAENNRLPHTLYNHGNVCRKRWIQYTKQSVHRRNATALISMPSGPPPSEGQ